MSYAQESEPIEAPGVVEPVASAVVTEVRVSCDLPRCSRDYFRDALVEVAGIPIGEPATELELAAARNRLVASGFFTDVTVSVEAAEGSAEGSVVTFEAAGAITIRKVRIRSAAALGSELRRRIFLRGGETWTGDQTVVERQRREIVSYFEGEGYFGTEVTITPDAVSEFAVDLTVRVSRGRRKSVDRIFVRGNEALTYDEINELLLRRLNVLRSFTVRRFEEAQLALIRRYRELGYIQARIVYDEHVVVGDTGRVNLFVEVREGPLWNIRFHGNTAFSRNELLQTLSFYDTGFIDDAEIDNAVREIQSLYETVGHFFVSVSARYSTGEGGVQSLTFDIIERQPAEIRQVDLVGVTAIPEWQLREVITTSEYDILSVGGYLQRSRLDQDVADIELAYRRRGFLNAVVPRVVFVGENDGRDLYVTLHVVEGQQTWVRDRDISGVPPEMLVDIQQAIEAFDEAEDSQRRSDRRPFDPDRVLQEQGVISAHLHSLGYAFSTVVTECFVDGSDEAVPCQGVERAASRARSSSRDRDVACARTQRGGRIVEECRFVVPDPAVPSLAGVDAEFVDVRHRIELGRPIAFGQVLVRGNFGTRRSTAAREVRLRPGDPYNVAALLESQSRLRSLGLFDSVRMSTIGATSDPDSGDVNHVVVQLEEAGTRYFEHRVGLEARAVDAQNLLLIFSNEPTFLDTDLFGRAKELRIFGNFDFDLLEPRRISNNEFRAGVGILYLARRFYLTRRMEDPWEAQAQITYDYDLLAVAPAPLTKELAFDARVREESDAVEGLFFELGVNLSQTRTLDQSDPAVTQDEFDPALILSFSPRVTFDRRRDNPLNPNRGFFAEINLQVADDFIGVLDSERFTKLTTQASGFVPLGHRFVLGVNGRFGAAFGGILDGFRSGGRLALPVAERFSLGGVTTLRGFGEGGVTSLDTDAFGGDFVLNANVELRYPFVRALALDAAVFVDTGQLMAEMSDFRFGEFRTTAGFGLRWIVGGLIPLVIDYGAVLGRRPGEDFGRLHFNVGYTF